MVRRSNRNRGYITKIVVVGLFLVIVIAMLASIYFTSNPNQKQDIRSRASEATSPLLSLDFNNGWNGTGGQAPTTVTGPAWLRPGPKGIGQSAYLYNNAALWYLSAGNINKDAGTLEFWFKPLTWNNDSTVAHRFLDVTFKCSNLSGPAGPCKNYMVLEIDNSPSESTKTIWFSIDDSQTAWLGSHGKTATAQVEIAPPYKRWYHIAVTWNKDFGSIIYVDGISVTQDNEPYSLNDPTDAAVDGSGHIIIAEASGLGPKFNVSADSIIDNYNIYGYVKDGPTIKSDYISDKSKFSAVTPTP